MQENVVPTTRDVVRRTSPGILAKQTCCRSSPATQSLQECGGAAQWPAANALAHGESLSRPSLKEQSRGHALFAQMPTTCIYRASHPRGSRNEAARAAAILSRLQPSTAWVRILDEARVNSKESNVKRNEQRVNECRVKSKA